ncbi:MAG TPA: hypothetical protein VIM33_07050 [Gaiellaceae bacterium]
MRYDAYLSKDDTRRRVEIDLDAQFKPGDEFRYGHDIYIVTRVGPGKDGSNLILFADLLWHRPE